MGREVKRVPLWFAWQLKRTWIGYLNPWSWHCGPCECGGTGLNPATKRLSDGWYDHGGDGSARWCDAITQDEVDALVEAGRLREWRDGKWQSVPRLAADVNVANHRGGSFFGDLHHDGINQSICVETRARRLGVYGVCDKCDGEGQVWNSPDAKAAHEAWRKVEPPAGDGWQVWETTSEGSPISAVCATPEALADWCVKHNVSTFGNHTATREQWLAFIAREWAPSMVMADGQLSSGVAAVLGGA